MSTTSVYVSRVRRAFLLRAHPDRFRSFAPQIRKQQANLIQAIAQRMEQQDFLSYTYGDMDVSVPTPPSFPILNYVLEQKDGSLKSYSLNLNDNVEGVLCSLVYALRQNGMISLPLPPKATRRLQEQASIPPRILWASSKSPATGIDHQYDIHWNRGRDLRHFLSTLDVHEISSRKASRMDVTATALAIRRDYQFSAVDGTGLGWSSTSFATVLRTLVDLFQEHSHSFRVPSFYPLRLVWSSEDQPIDLYGGNLFLNPASTPIQWLDLLLSVTPDALALQKELRARLNHNSILVNNFFNASFQKGHSCSSREYFDIIERLSYVAPLHTHIESFPRALALERIHVVVESSQTCRRGILTKDGHIRVGSSMSSEDIVSAVSGLQVKARAKLSQTLIDKKVVQDASKEIQLKLGLLRIRRSKTVTDRQFVDALLRLGDLEEREELRRKLTGNSLDIVCKGQFCHLGDDGSLMIPWDWS